MDQRKTLTKELEGIIMGENEIAKLREKAKDPTVLNYLDNILKTVQKNKDLIVKEIEELNTEVPQDEGLFGKIVEFFNSFKEKNIDSDKDILREAIKGTEMGFKAILDLIIEDNKVHEHLKKDLIEVSKEYTTHIKNMEEYLLSLK